MKKISILGSTGSVGVSTLDFVARHPDKFQVVGLAAGSNIEVLARQINAFSPRVVSVKSEAEVYKLKKILGPKSPEILFGSDGVVSIATLPEVHTVVSAIVGAAGLLPTLAALQASKTVALANKESMVIAGELMSREKKKYGGTIFPVDSEHSALFQCLQAGKKEDVQKLVLTASGGPFLNKPREDFSKITVEEALKHPNWSMGAKITIDSASMMNKGLEVMEARWLFDMPLDKIDVCVHPQSIIHSMVSYQDGSVMAHMGLPDMRVPIAYALSFPERFQTGVAPLDLASLGQLTFLKPDMEKFPSLKLAFEVAKKGKTYPAVLNAANEIVVAAFLKKKIAFLEMIRLISLVLDAHIPQEVASLEVLLEADRWAREYCENLIFGTKL
ncbi:MAG TPA: 1-deoxy-D-xylulose-5-phosphate reductoisomerase [Deltaproteobacteria bacterium]|nr:MAG: 1-deoxy-D-xylulose-5-phosphate reductoisomerase [Deltaproteobacteria bacterium GWA2_45_12]HBF11785.1 1-deoxy-D-xylulose-5-phosphate reductoisomerase [Deltaproteobacteria bacterium]